MSNIDKIKYYLPRRAAHPARSRSRSPLSRLGSTNKQDSACPPGEDQEVMAELVQLARQDEAVPDLAPHEKDEFARFLKGLPQDRIFLRLLQGLTVSYYRKVR
jgi:hypothetical protein